MPSPRIKWEKIVKATGLPAHRADKLLHFAETIGLQNEDDPMLAYVALLGVLDQTVDIAADRIRQEGAEVLLRLQNTSEKIRTSSDDLDRRIDDAVDRGVQTMHAAIRNILNDTQRELAAVTAARARAEKRSLNKMLLICVLLTTMILSSFGMIGFMLHREAVADAVTRERAAWQSRAEAYTPTR